MSEEYGFALALHKMNQDDKEKKKDDDLNMLIWIIISATVAYIVMHVAAAYMRNN